MKLSIIIPVFNEEKTITETITKVLAVDIPNLTKEVVVVNDGSTDETSEKLKAQNLRNRSIKIITHEKNQGKGAAVRKGMENATGDYIIIQDADLEYDPKDIKKLIEPIKNGNAKVVYGTRLNRLPNFSRDERTLQFLVHYIGNKFLSFLTSILYGQWITDMETGYKLFPRKLGQDMNLSSKSFELEPEITAKILKKGFKILEVPISTNPRGYDQGKKLNTFRDGAKALFAIIKYKF